jgi:hypothetical protein
MRIAWRRYGEGGGIRPPMGYRGRKGTGVIRGLALDLEFILVDLLGLAPPPWPPHIRRSRRGRNYCMWGRDIASQRILRFVAIIDCLLEPVARQEPD